MPKKIRRTIKGELKAWGKLLVKEAGAMGKTLERESANFAKDTGKVATFMVSGKK